MIYRTEAKLQGWRALAVFEDGSEALIYLGRSTTQVRSGYAAAFQEVLDETERAQVTKINLQCWNGAPDEGRWITKNTLAVPGRAAPVREPMEEPAAKILPFRKPAAAAVRAALTDELQETPVALAPTA